MSLLFFCVGCVHVPAGHAPLSHHLRGHHRQHLHPLAGGKQTSLRSSLLIIARLRSWSRLEQGYLDNRSKKSILTKYLLTDNREELR